MIEYRRECLLTTKDELVPLIEAHWQEVESNKDTIALAPDWDEYSALDKAGILRIFTARKGGKMVGYLSMIMNKSLHHKGHMFAVEDGLFLDSEYRGGSTAIKLLKFAERYIVNEGGSMIFMTTKADHPIDSLLKRLGYTLAERSYSKNLVEV